jgi:hypothetical protein
MSLPQWNPYGNFVTSDPNGLPVDRRPLRLGLYLQNQAFSPVHSTNGTKLLQSFKYFRNMGWGGNVLLTVAAVVAITPELLDASTFSTQVGLISGGTTALGGVGVKFWSKVQTDETTAQMETEFNGLKEKIILHNKNPSNVEKQMVVPYLADPSLSERLAEAHISHTNSDATNNLSNVPNNIATAGVVLEALKIMKSLRKKD